MQKNITGCVGSARSVETTRALPQLKAVCASRRTLLRLQAALQGHCPKRALRFVHFPGLSRSSSGPRVLHKGTDSVEPAFCAIPGSSSSGDQVLGEHTLPRWGGASYHLPGPSHSVSQVCHKSTISDVLCIPSVS